MKYKLLKDAPGLKAGSIWEKKGAEYFSENNFYDAFTVENNPEWFAPYLFTTQDNVDIYETEVVYLLVLQDYNDRSVKKDTILKLPAYSATGYWNKNTWLIFSTKEAALLHLAKQKFPVGTVFKSTLLGNLSIVENENFVWDTFYHYIYYKGNSVWCDGKWAEILPKFEIGKWYSINDNKFIKFSHFNDNFIIGEVIALDTSEFLANKYIWLGHIRKYDLLKDLSVIQPYLPENHVDKAIDWEVGEYVVFINNEGIGNIPKGSLARVGLNTLDKYSFLDVNWLESKYLDGQYLVDRFRKATESEIIAYYEKLGWVKGAKFRSNNNKVYILKKLNMYYSDVYCAIEGFSSFRNIKDCTLVSEPDYPKSWGELKPKYVSVYAFNNTDEYLSEAYKNNFGYYIKNDANIVQSGQISRLTDCDKDIFATKEQAKSALAFAQLSQLHKAMIDEYNKINNCDWKPVFSCKSLNFNYTVSRQEDDLCVVAYSVTFAYLTFPTEEMAKFSLEHHKELWEQFYGISN